MSALGLTLLVAAPIGGGGGAGFRRARARARAASSASASASSSASASLYEVLGVAEGEARAEEIRRAYRSMARRLHPDAADGCARRFIAVRAAFDTLSDPARRALYDRSLAHSSRSYHQGLDERSHWRNHWQDQIAELYWRSINKDSEDNLSWGARMRRKRDGSLN